MRRERHDPYRGFSRVYDQDVHVEVPRAFFRTLEPLIEARADGPPILEVGCGSGLLTERLARAGARVVGVDASREMLAQARRRCESLGGRVAFAHARVERFRPAERARLALACHDVMNHMPSTAAMRRVLASIHRALLPDGLLVFDTITEYCFETYWPDNTHVLTGPLGDVVMSCDWEPEKRRGTVHVIGYARRGRGLFARTESVLHEYLHRDRDVVRALRGAGFERVWSRPWSPWRVQDAEAQRHRRLWCASAGPSGTATSRLLARIGFRRARASSSPSS